VTRARSPCHTRLPCRALTVCQWTSGTSAFSAGHIPESVNRTPHRCLNDTSECVLCTVYHTHRRHHTPRLAPCSPSTTQSSGLMRCHHSMLALWHCILLMHTICAVCPATVYACDQPLQLSCPRGLWTPQPPGFTMATTRRTPTTAPSSDSLTTTARPLRPVELTIPG